MPRAGNNSANRAKAHLQWADRYSRYGDTQKAAAHFGRALEYDRRSGRNRGQEFGGFEVDGHEIGVSREVIAGAAGAAAIAAGALVPVANKIADKAVSAAYTMATNAKNYMFPKPDYTGKVAEGAEDEHDGSKGPAKEDYKEHKDVKGQETHRAYDVKSGPARNAFQEQPRAYDVKPGPARADSYNASDYKEVKGTGYPGNSTPSGSKTDEPWRATGKTDEPARENEGKTDEHAYQSQEKRGSEGAMGTWFGQTDNRRRRYN